MRFKFLFLACLISFSPMAPHAAPISLTTNDHLLVLSPPAYLNVDEVGPTWAKLSWPLVSGAIGYRIITREVSSGTIVNNQVVMGVFGLATVPGLTPGLTYQSEIKSIDSNNQESETSTFSNQYDAIIIELVTNDFSAPSTCPAVCQLNVSCSFDWGYFAVTTFTIHNTSTQNQVIRGFKITTFGEDIVRVQGTQTGSGQQYFQFEVVDERYLVIRYAGAIVATLEASKAVASQNGLLSRYGTNNNLDYAILKRKCTGGGGGGTGMGDFGDRDEYEDIYVKNSLIASPNPFIDELQLQLPVSNKEQVVNIALYNLQGQVIYRRSVTADTQSLTIPTQNIQAGLYMVQATLGDQIFSIKAIKTQ